MTETPLPRYHKPYRYVPKPPKKQKYKPKPRQMGRPMIDPEEGRMVESVKLGITAKTKVKLEQVRAELQRQEGLTVSAAAGIRACIDFAHRALLGLRHRMDSYANEPEEEEEE